MDPRKHNKAALILEDGSSFSGYSFGYEGSTSGEVVFSTGMVGYKKSLTDPSYSGQILMFTFPLIGNYGVGDDSVDEWGIHKNFESTKIHVKGLLVSEYSEEHHHWNAEESLQDWLKREKIPALFGIDTRALTIKIREKGVMLGKIVVSEEPELYNPNKENQVALVSCTEKKVYGKGKYHLVAIDCGMKNNIIRCLLRRDVTLTVVPWDYDFTEDGQEYDGLFISNGPGDPEFCKETIGNIQKWMKTKKPIFGICLGNQLLAIAAGAKTFKLKYGHRAQNQPCIDPEGKAVITSQNHGFAVDADSLPKEWEVFFTNANDHTNEGIRHKALPFFSVQFHPEGWSGPEDTGYLFDEFIDSVKKNKK